MIDRDMAEGPATRSVRLYYDVENRWIGQTIDADGAGTAAALQVTAFAYQGTQIALQYAGTVADNGGRPRRWRPAT